MKHRLLVISCAVFALISACAPAQDTPSPLRLAIIDLMRTFGDKYPRGREYLARLDDIEAAKADYEELRREALIANPLVSGRPIVFVVRPQYAPDHHNTETMFENGQYIDGRFRAGGALKTIDLKTGKVATLVDVPNGIARDPEVDFSGTKIVFSMRRDQADSYHIYEINGDGTGPRQLTRKAGVSDFDPAYLPDGRIVFASTRDPKIVPCNRHICANLFEMEPDGANIHQISKNTLFDGHPSIMPDGRILYDRWEYVDRAFGDAQGLWTANPDGTSHALLYGNNTPSPGGEIDGRAIPGSEAVICTMVCCHDRPWGAIGIIDRSRGMDGRAPVIMTWPANAIDLVRDPGTANEAWDYFAPVNPKYEDPYPLSAKYFLCSKMTGNGEQMGIYLLDAFGNEILLHAEGPGCYDPMPLAAHKRPPVIADKRLYDGSDGRFYIENVYRGTHMKGVAPGSVKFLRVIEVIPKMVRTIVTWGGQGIECPGVNWHDFMCKRILGTVPVEKDGSAYFSAPSEKFVCFQLLDENGMMIQSMRSGTYLQAGERAGCIGCHEDRRTSPVSAGSVPSAFTRPPSKLEDWHGPRRAFNYLAEVQPVFDRRCVSCHDFGKHDGSVLNLAGDKDFIFNASYNELWRKGYVKVVGAGPAEIQQAYSWGSHASRLIKTLRGEHHGVKLTAEEMDRLITWVDLNAPYYPDYATAYPDNLAGRCPLDNGQIGRLRQLTRVDFVGNASFNGNQGPLISFDRPELSPCLASLADKHSDAYREALAIITSGQKNLKDRPDCDMPGFQPCRADAERLARAKGLAANESKNREAILKRTKFLDKE